jgi:hypothetical protein
MTAAEAVGLAEIGAPYGSAKKVVRYSSRDEAIRPEKKPCAECRP